jgi:hypothetical protein
MGQAELEYLWRIIAAVVAALCGVLWWNFRGVSTDLKGTKGELSDFKLYVANNFAKHSDLEKTANQFEKVAERIEAKLDSLFAKLDRKADKA